MQISPYLLFNGNCAEAFKFYEGCLGGKIEGMMTHGQSPMNDNVAPDWRDKIIHARMNVGDQALMGSDVPPQHYSRPQGYSVSIGIRDLSEAERIFKNLSEGANVTMPFQKTFWSAGFGMLTDRFGTPWMVNCEQTA
jgi:PhnB protein